MENEPMGKGDLKTRRGKIFRGTTGKTRQKKRKIDRTTKKADK
jgi:ribosomal small subunit protein bTHX